MKIVVKIGTQSILTDQGTPLVAVLEGLVQQLATLVKENHQIILVSSGAVGFGRGLARQTMGKEYGMKLAEKQVLASLGQHELMHLYAELFKKHHLLTSQLLLTKQDFYKRKHYLNIARVLDEVLKQKAVMPIVNENDSVAVEELMFTDNDELAGLIAAQTDADRLIIFSNVEGVYDANPQDPAAKLIPLINPEEGWPNIGTSKSTHGRGGMISKLSTAKKMSRLGITTQIACLHHDDTLLRLVAGEPLGTTILAHKKTSNIKKWIAYSQDRKGGKIVINQCLYDAFQDNKRILSILPVGIVSFNGHFEKGDIVDIIGPQGQRVGVGLARYDMTKLQEYVGQQKKPAFIHYDHLHIF